MALRMDSVAEIGGCRNVERIKGLVCGLLLAVGLLLSPTLALADDGFVGGLQDLVGVRDIDNLGEPVETEPESKGESLRAVPLPKPELPEDPEMIDYVKYFMETVNRVPTSANGSSGFSMLDEAAWFIRVIIVPIVVGIVFLWWGVRKSVRMIFSSFRKGSASV